MKFWLLSVLLLLYSSSAFTCMIPNRGAEFDNLIEITRLEEQDKFLVSLPRKIASSTGFPIIELVYQSIELEDDCEESILDDGTQLICLPKDEYRQEIQLQNFFYDFFDLVTGEESYSGNIEISPKDGYLVFLRVMWNTEVCLTFAEKEVI